MKGRRMTLFCEEFCAIPMMQFRFWPKGRSSLLILAEVANIAFDSGRRSEHRF
jgi:hypothetical protein